MHGHLELEHQSAMAWLKSLLSTFFHLNCTGVQPLLKFWDLENLHDANVACKLNYIRGRSQTTFTS